MEILLFPIAFVFIGYLIFGKKKENPYIRLHKNKWKNETDYQQYLKWLDKKGGDVPLKQAKFNDEKEVERELSKHLNR